jgi:hypothetical protein
MPTYPAAVTSLDKGDLYRAWLNNLGITQLSLSEGECLESLANAASGSTSVGLYGPANSIAESTRRTNITSAALALSGSGTLQMVAVYLSAGQVITNINVLPGSTGSTTMTHQWAGLFSGPASGPLLVATSADALTATITASTVATYAIATTAAGTATTYTVPTTGIYYVGLLWAFTSTAPTLSGTASLTAAGQTIPPILAGASTTGLTGVLTFPATAQTTITASVIQYYAYLT